MSILLGQHYWRKQNLPLIESHQLTRAPQIEVRFHEIIRSLWRDYGWLDFVQLLCIQSQILWVQMCTCTVMSNKYYFAIDALPSDSYNLCPSLLWSSMSLVQRNCDIDVVFICEHIAVACSMHVCWLWVFVLITTFYIKKLIKWGSRYTLIYEYEDKNLVDSLLLYAFSRRIALSSHLWTMTYHSWGFDPVNIRNGFYLMEHILNPVRKWLVIP